MTSSATISTTKDTDSTAGAFTPGPWYAGPSHNFPGTWLINGSNDVGGGPVLPHLARTENFGNNAEANARLIAAAPDMYEALSLVRMSGGWHYMAAETREIIIAAIAKAEGRS